MKVDVFDLNGKAVEKIDLPAVFREQVREDLIRRAVLATQSRHRQAYGTDPYAGLRSSAEYIGMRHHRYSMMNKEMARMPRIHGKTSPMLTWRVRIVPQSVKGRVSHPPVVEKVWEQKINDKERKKAIRSAIAATAVKQLVAKRGHKFPFEELPVVVDDELQSLKKAKDVVVFFKKIGLEKELERISQKKVRVGRGKNRGRKYKKKIGPLVVVAEDKGIFNAVKNIQGVSICKASNLGAEYLAPGTMPGRLTIFTKSALENLRKLSGE